MSLFKYLLFTIVFLSATLRAEEPPLLSPSLNINGIYGTSSADHPGDFAPGGHDPKRSDALILQALEPSVSLRYGDYIQGFVTGLAYTDAEDNLEWEWEEYFLTFIDMDTGYEIRGGRMLSRVGFHNPTHLHSWNTIDAPLPHSLFLGEDGLALEGGDLSFYLGESKRSVITLGFGQRPSHDHDHGHGGEDDHHDDDDDHDEEGDHHEEDHGHEDHDHGSGAEAFEAFRAMDDVFTLGLRHDVVFDDFRTLKGALFGGLGDNESGSDSWFAGAGVEYQWRENGFEPGGRALRWRTEVILFDSEASAHDHDDEHGHDDEDHDEDHDDHSDEHEEEGMGFSTWGFTTEVLVEAHPNAHPFARIDYVAESEEIELDDWIRYTFGATFPIVNDPAGLYFRLQANLDERGDESEQSYWAQVGLSWGGPEVR